MKEKNWIKLGSLSLLTDRKGSPCKDENGLIKSLFADFGLLDVRVESSVNPYTKEPEYDIFISTFYWRSFGIEKFLSGKEGE